MKNLSKLEEAVYQVVVDKQLQSGAYVNWRTARYRGALLCRPSRAWPLSPDFAR